MREKRRKAALQRMRDGVSRRRYGAVQYGPAEGGVKCADVSAFSSKGDVFCFGKTVKSAL